MSAERARRASPIVVGAVAIGGVPAVLFGQLVDDPGAWPERFSAEEARERERAQIQDTGVRDRVISRSK